MRNCLLVCALGAALFGCAKPHPEQAPQIPPKVELPQPAPAPIPAPPPEKPREPTAADRAAAQDGALQAAELLQDGKVEETRAALRRSLKLDPRNILAATLMRQLEEDPTAILGKESFQYKVVSGDTLSRIADRFLGDKYMFYALARYNGIATPRQLQAGQSIKVLGKAPKEPPRSIAEVPRKPLPAPTPTPSAVDESAIAKLYDSTVQRCKAAEPLRSAGKVSDALDQLDRGHQSYREATRLGGQSTELLARRDLAKRCLTDGYYRDGMKALYNQDLDLAIALLGRVQEIDSEHRLARENHTKAVYLKEKLEADRAASKPTAAR